jgi:hypothetical protein
MNKLIAIVFAAGLVLTSCEKKSQEIDLADAKQIKVAPVHIYGYDLNNYNIVEDTVRAGDIFNDLIG